MPTESVPVNPVNADVKSTQSQLSVDGAIIISIARDLAADVKVEDPVYFAYINTRPFTVDVIVRGSYGCKRGVCDLLLAIWTR